jgi:Alpha/beta hydrolase of unknown function (DUF900)
MVGQQTVYLDIDLAASDVPRFGDNVFFEVTARASEEGHEGVARARAGILLPVVIVPGIRPFWWTPRPTFDRLINYLVDKSAADLRLFGYLGDGYLRDMTTPSYPTVFVLNYEVNRNSFTRGAIRLDNLIRSILKRTYAARVNIIGHSKGGLVSRQYLVGDPVTGLESGAETVAGVIMAAVPNLGSVYATHEEWFPRDYFTNL